MSLLGVYIYEMLYFLTSPSYWKKKYYYKLQWSIQTSFSQVEILGLYDRKMKSYRLFASEPEPGSSSRQRFIRILKPLENVVHTNALILCDQSVDRNCLYNMGFTRVSSG